MRTGTFHNKQGKMAERAVIKVLLIEQDAKDAARLSAVLSECREPAFETMAVASVMEGERAMLLSSPPDVVLLSLSESAENLVLLKNLREVILRIPVILLAHTKDEEAALHAVREGAQDYLIKSDVNARILSRVIRYAISRKQSEDSLLHAYEQIGFLLASIPSILIGVNPAGKITHWNATAETVFGIPGNRVMKAQLNAIGLKWEHEKIEKGIQEAFRTGTNVRVDDVSFMKDKKERMLGFRIIPIQGHESGDSYALLFGADITERKQLENMKDEFVSTVSHELRTPLLMIREGVSLVHDGILGPATDDQKKFLTVSLDNIDRLTRIINDLLDISKIEAAKMKLQKEKVNLNQLISKIETGFGPVLRGREVSLKTRLPEKPVEIEADPDKLTQVFTNLIQNAVKFTEKGFIEVALESKSDEVECSVSDSGRGISSEDMEKVFSKFQQFGRTHGAGAKGTGLGLSICKGLVELHGGRIRVESELDKGTRFIFTLPKRQG